MTSRLLAIGLAGVSYACATAAKPRAVDLQPARQALEEARAGGAPERAPQTFTHAEGQLREAERLVAARGPEAPMAALEAEWAARLALAEARCAARDASTPTAEEVRRLEARSRRSEDELHRLEEQLALSQRELEVTETELIRTKARLKGLETRAEASSAIAEARILVKRLEAKGRSAALRAAAEESLNKAEDQLTLDNYGAALFFALKAQDLVTKAGDARSATDGEPERPAPQSSYTVTAEVVKIRQDPSAQAPVVGEARRGARLQALALRGTWLRVRYGDVKGWVPLRILE